MMGAFAAQALAPAGRISLSDGSRRFSAGSRPIDLRTQTKSVRSDRLAVAMLEMIASGGWPPAPPARQRRLAERPIAEAPPPAASACAARSIA